MTCREDLRRPLSDSQRIRFAKEIKGLKVEVTHTDPIRRKYRVCNVTRRPASAQTYVTVCACNHNYFTLLSRFPLQLDSGDVFDCSVVQYFNEKYKMNLRYPFLPCLQVGQEKKQTYLPLEVRDVPTSTLCVGAKPSDQSPVKNQTVQEAATLWLPRWCSSAATLWLP